MGPGREGERESEHTDRDTGLLQDVNGADVQASWRWCVSGAEGSPGHGSWSLI